MYEENRKASINAHMHYKGPSVPLHKRLEKLYDEAFKAGQGIQTEIIDTTAEVAPNQLELNRSTEATATD